MQDQDTSNPIPHGYCQCGCGQKTTVPKASNAYYGYIRGVPLRYVHGHNQLGNSRATIPPPNPSGLCMCGCGEKTPIARKTDQAVPQLKGHPVRYISGHNTRLSPLEYVAEDRGFNSPCWIWQRAQDGHGYGSTGDDKAHRKMYERHIGPVPDGLQLDHLCRQRDCVNPYHLEPVTSQVNSQRGANAKLSPDDVREIRRIGGSLSQRKIAAMFGVSHNVVGHVLRRETWANIDPEEAAA